MIIVLFTQDYIHDAEIWGGGMEKGMGGGTPMVVMEIITISTTYSWSVIDGNIYVPPLPPTHTSFIL